MKIPELLRRILPTVTLALGLFSSSVGMVGLESHQASVRNWMYHRILPWKSSSVGVSVKASGQWKVSGQWKSSRSLSFPVIYQVRFRGMVIA